MKLDKSHANPVWKHTAFKTFLVLPNSFFIAAIAPKHGAENKLNIVNANAEAGVKNPKAPVLLKIFIELVLSAKPLITAIDDTTCSFAISPCIAETVTSQLFTPTIGLNIQDILFPKFANMLCLISMPYSILGENANKNHTIIEHKKIVVPALFIKAKTLFVVSFNTYFKLGNLYSGSSEIYVLDVPLNTIFFINNALTIIINIARKYNTTVEEIMKLNNLKNDLLSIGTVLTIPEISQSTSTNRYTVKAGDTLWNISKRYNTTVEELMMLNNLSNDLIMIGQELILPNTNVHIVKAGDTLWNIAKRHNTTVENLMKINNLSSDLIKIGQVIRL